MDAFVDRTEELAALEEQFADHQAAMVVIYGRRRIGKTALITEFVRDKRALYFLATEESEEQNRAAFQKQVAAFTGDELLGQVSVDNWDVLFDRLTSDGERLVVALDEFQYLGKANPAFPSVFQRIWDTMLSKRNVMVILCGSLISLMESQVLSYSSPLYGRRTAQVRMKQIPFRFYRDFFSKEIGRRELVELYSVTGGVPKYIESFRGVDDVYRGIEKSVLNSSSYLYDEPNFLLSKEVSEVGTYFSILKAVAAGNRKSGEIAAALNVRQTGLSKYLKVLERLDVLERVVPVTEANP
ncbi:AAA family ATPase [Adlercreutzia sp.]|uniref:AAA family ATPase n=1 Tax=Adlercreutzia sp. TaxID=1872387 RepID=UPI002E7939DB|nr:ATP-binding protein [Adlercreutzia sp.]MEE0635849.1 ATP-binding protein [Adlercreutzia sp.]